jgi:hypothetical protein
MTKLMTHMNSKLECSIWTTTAREVECTPVRNQTHWQGKVLNVWSLSADPCRHFDLLQKFSGICRLLIMEWCEWHFITFFKGQAFRHSWRRVNGLLYVHRCMRILRALLGFHPLTSCVVFQFSAVTPFFLTYVVCHAVTKRADRQYG